MKKIFFLLIILFITSCSTTKHLVVKQTIISETDSIYIKELNSINVREIGLQDAYKAFGYPDTVYIVNK